MPGILLISPGLVHHEPGIFRDPHLYIFIKRRQERFESFIFPGQGACLLEADIVPRLVRQNLLQCHAADFLLYRTASLADLAVGIIRHIVFRVVQMSFQSASSDKDIADDDRNPVGFGKFIKILLDGILREAVPYGKDPDRVLRRPSQHRNAQKQCQYRQQKYPFHRIFINN